MTTIVNPLPYNILNGTPIDAIPVMADLNWIVSQVNANVTAAIPANTSSIPTFVPLASVAGTANAIQLTPTPVIAAYAAGQRFAFVAAFTNTTATTIATSGLAVRALKYEDGTAMSGGEILAGGVYDIIDNGTNYVLMNSSQGSGIVAFTPAITFGGASVGVTYSFRAGASYKVGRVVYFALDLLLTSKGSSTGDVAITGLPYSVSTAFPTGSGTYVPVTAYSVSFSGGPAAYLMAAVATNLLSIVTVETSQLVQNLSDGSVNNNSEFLISGFYIV